MDDDIVNEQYEWEQYGEWELFGDREPVSAGDVDWLAMEELLAIDCGDPPPPPAYPMVVEKDGKSM